MTVDSAALLRDLQAELKPLVDDLRTRCDSTPEVDEPLRVEWQVAASAARTARSFTVWREDLLVDVAVAWLLDLPPLTAQVAVVAAGLPSGVNSYLIAVQFNTGQALASNQMTIATAGAAITTSFWVMILHYLYD